LPRYDDEHRGPAVLDAYALSTCWIDLAQDSEAWPVPNNFPPALLALAQRVPDDQRSDWLRRQAHLKEVDRIISDAMRSGELHIWVAPVGGPEQRVAPGAMLEVDQATIQSGCYRPPNDRGWLFGRPLFVKWDDWVRFKGKVQETKMEERPASDGEHGLLSDGSSQPRNAAGQVTVLSAQAALPRYPGDPNKGWIELQDAFEGGTVRTAISQSPPSVADDLLNRDDLGSEAWWRAYSRDITRAKPPMLWVNWFLGGGILVDVADLRAHVRRKFEEERAFFQCRRRRGLAPSTWTDLQAWAWIASRDHALVEAVGDFVRVEFQNPSNPGYARQMAIEYLQFRVREDFCKCGAELALVEPNKCKCSEGSWLGLVEALKDRRLTATAADNDGMQLPVSPEAFRGAVYDWRLQKFLLTGATRETLFDRREVERHFPHQQVEPPEHHHGPILWGDLDPEDLPVLERLCAESHQDEWWTWPEAIAWMGSRDLKNIATIRFWAPEFSRRSGRGPADTLRTQASMAMQYCERESESKAELLKAIESGKVSTSGRMSKGSAATDLPPNIWRGGTVVYHDAEAVLVDAKSRLTVWAFDVAVRRADLMRIFPDPSLSAALTRGNTRAPSMKWSRPPPDDAIREKAAEMRARGLTGYEIASAIRLEPGFERVGTVLAREVIKGMWKGGRRKVNDAS
jgi:hypothetical protein